MRDLLALLVHFLITLARLLGPGGARAVIAETMLIKHQLVILNRSRRRAPNLTATDRIVMGLCTLFMNPSRILSDGHHTPQKDSPHRFFLRAKSRSRPPAPPAGPEVAEGG